MVLSLILNAVPGRHYRPNLKVISWGLYRGFIRFLLPQPWFYKLFVTLTGTYAICFHVLIYFPWGFLYHVPRASPVGMTHTSSPVGASACWSPRPTSYWLTTYYPRGVWTSSKARLFASLFERPRKVPRIVMQIDVLYYWYKYILWR